jgi:hypothetical protein
MEGPDSLLEMIDAPCGDPAPNRIAVLSSEHYSR